jgi:hypothetical protein
MKTIQWDGKPISKPGIYAGIDIDLYHAAGICDSPSISSGGMRTIYNESPAHFFAEWRGNPKAVERKESRAFVIGRAAHHLHLGQDDFSSLFAIEPTEYEADKGEIKPWNNNAKECRAWTSKRKEESKTILKPKEAEQIIGMAEELGRHPIVASGALNGAVERSMFWKDKKTGIWLKSRPDAIPGDSGDFVDYKTTDSVQWYDLMKSVASFGYHMQGSLICEAAREVLRVNNPSFTLVFQEKAPPYCVRVVTLKESDLARGAKQNRMALDTFAECLKTGVWPGPGGLREDAEFLELPEWAQKQIDERLEQGTAS